MKFCVDCKHYSGITGDGQWFWEKPCLRPGLVNLVNGRQNVSCMTERYPDTNIRPDCSDRSDCCGREGKYFERKED